MADSTPIEWPVTVCCFPDFPGGCVCLPMERALRGWMRGDELPVMTAEQRDACLSEIERGEGYFRSDHEKDSDADLSRATLGAWLDYARDKGLI